MTNYAIIIIKIWFKVSLLQSYTFPDIAALLYNKLPSTVIWLCLSSISVLSVGPLVSYVFDQNCRVRKL